MSCVDEKRPDVVPLDADNEAIPQAEGDNSILPTRVAIECLRLTYHDWIIEILDGRVRLVGPSRLMEGFADVGPLSESAISLDPSIADVDA